LPRNTNHWKRGRCEELRHVPLNLHAAINVPASQARPLKKTGRAMRAPQGKDPVGKLLSSPLLALLGFLLALLCFLGLFGHAHCLLSGFSSLGVRMQDENFLITHTSDSFLRSHARDVKGKLAARETNGQPEKLFHGRGIAKYPSRVSKVRLGRRTRTSMER
ncbi:MAG TPA: hypothetical protein VGA40_01380, partial [Candidatus Acidoferrales bacterium]